MAVYQHGCLLDAVDYSLIIIYSLRYLIVAIVPGFLDCSMVVVILPAEISAL
jgi:hypothetical protein